MAEWFPLDTGDQYQPEPDPSAQYAGMPPLAELPMDMGGEPEDDGMSGLLAVGMDMMREPQEGEFAGADWGSEDPQVHDANLAQFLEKGQLDRLAQNIITWVDRDKQSRREWEQKEAEGIRNLGLRNADIERIRASIQPWQTPIAHPGLMKAAIQFFARAFTELFPAAGPAKSVVMGASNEDREQQASRVSGFLNYQYTQAMPGAYREAGRSMFLLPLSGSHFRKAFFDPILGALRVVGIESQDFIKPYSAVDLRSASRYTHIVRWTRNDLNKAIALGYYLDIVKFEPTSEGHKAGILDQAKDEAVGSRPMSGDGGSDPEYDSRDLGYETSAILDLSEYGWDDPLGESVTGKSGKRLSIGVPYLVTVHDETQQVLSIRRDWRESDRKKSRRRNVVEYTFLPGFKGYGLGLFHIAADLNTAQTAFLRSLIDGRTLGILGATSGFVSQSAVGLSGLPTLKMGEFQKVSLSAEELAKSFWSPKVQDNPQETMPVLQYLDTMLDFLVAATEAVIGDDNQNIPVGTVLARKEERTLPFQAIFRGMHASLAEELRAVAELSADYLDERYPYLVEGADQEVFAHDFDNTVDVVPVSDANYVSASQRMQQAHFLFEKAVDLHKLNASPETWANLLMTHHYMLEMMRIPSPDRFVPAMPAPPTPPDPTQGQAPPTPDPVAAEVARKDAETGAKVIATQADIARKDAKVQADIDAKAQQMQADMQMRATGDRAVVAEENDAETEQLAQEILAAARKQQLEQQQRVIQ